MLGRFLVLKRLRLQQQVGEEWQRQVGEEESSQHWEVVVEQTHQLAYSA
jgi:hypothetical protein